jgi:hypothetical protein
VKFLRHLEKEVPPDRGPHLILGNYRRHYSAAAQGGLKPKQRRRLHFHSTPTSSSYLNQGEGCFGLRDLYSPVPLAHGTEAQATLVSTN